MGTCFGSRNDWEQHIWITWSSETILWSLDTWQLAIGCMYMCIAEKQGKNFSWLHNATPPYWGFLLPSASHLPLGCGSPQELQTCRKRLSLPNLQSPLNLLYLVQTGLLVYPRCNWKKADIHVCLHAAVGCMVKALTMNTPSFRANCLPCKAVGIGSTFVHDLDGLFVASCLKFGHTRPTMSICIFGWRGESDHCGVNVSRQWCLRSSFPSLDASVSTWHTKTCLVKIFTSVWTSVSFWCSVVGLHSFVKNGWCPKSVIVSNRH